MAAEVTRADIDRLHNRLDQMGETQTVVRMTLVRIEERLEAMPEIPPRPCPDFVAHAAEHVRREQEARQTWRDVLLRLAGPTLAAASGAIAAILGMGNGGK